MESGNFSDRASGLSGVHCLLSLIRRSLLNRKAIATFTQMKIARFLSILDEIAENRPLGSQLTTIAQD
ncbi:MAG: hypothetical protein ACM37W_02475 [Actinomycetota bacterium]